MKILVYLAHPRPDRSQVNQPMFEAAQSIDGISTIDLYATYPTFDIDVAQEQARLAAHEVIVFLHPLYWGSAPALLKEWIDQVFDYGRPVAGPSQGGHGKILVNAVSCADAPVDDHRAGADGSDLRLLLAPFENTAAACQMIYLAPFALFDADTAPLDGRLHRHLGDWQRLLLRLGAGRLDITAARRARLLNGVATMETG